MIALAIALLLAQAHEWPQPGENATVEEKCKDSCRKDHCASWLKCNDIDDAVEREKCKDRTTEDENRCRKSCGEPRG